MAEKSEPFLIIDHNGTKIDFTRKICIGIVRSVFIVVSQLIAIPTYLVFFIILFPLRMLAPNLYWSLEGIAYRNLLLMAASWQWSAGYTVAEAGDDLMTVVGDRAIMMGNHQSTGDVPTLFYALQPKSSVIDDLMWIQDVLFKLTDFGWVSIVHGDFFIQQGKETRSLQNKRLAKHIEESYIPTDKSWIVVFPEGGFLYKRRESSQRYARQNGHPHLEHVSLPRIGAIQTILQSLSPKVVQPNMKEASGGKTRPLKWLVDVTIGYPENKTLNLQTIMMGTRKPIVVTVHYRIFPIEEIPVETGALTDWLYKRFEEKERMLDTFYQTGQFPTWDSNKWKIDSGQLLKPRPIHLPDEKVIVVHFIYLLAGCFILNLILCPVFGLVSSTFSLL